MARANKEAIYMSLNCDKQYYLQDIICTSHQTLEKIFIQMMVDHPDRCTEQMNSGKHPAQMRYADDIL